MAHNCTIISCLHQMFFGKNDEYTVFNSDFCATISSCTIKIPALEGDSCLFIHITTSHRFFKGINGWVNIFLLHATPLFSLSWLYTLLMMLYRSQALYCSLQKYIPSDFPVHPRHMVTFLCTAESNHGHENLAAKEETVVPAKNCWNLSITISLIHHHAQNLYRKTLKRSGSYQTKTDLRISCQW